MKTIIKTLILISLSSCTKDWVCTIETTSNGTTTSHEYNFEGTTEEAQQFEAESTQHYDADAITPEIDQVTTCVLD